jgi:hypothetical protein
VSSRKRSDKDSYCTRKNIQKLEHILETKVNVCMHKIHLCILILVARLMSSIEFIFDEIILFSPLIVVIIINIIIIVIENK